MVLVKEDGILHLVKSHLQMVTCKEPPYHTRKSHELFHILICINYLVSFKPSHDKLAKTWTACRYLETELIALELTKRHVRHCVVCHDYEYSIRQDIFPWLFGLQVSMQNTLAKSYLSLFDFGYFPLHALFRPAIWTVTVSQSTGAADFHREEHFWGKAKLYQKTVNKGEDKSKQTRLPTLFADLPENTLCPMCCFPSVDLVFVFTQLDSTSVCLKKKALRTKLACWSIKRRDE